MVVLLCQSKPRHTFINASMYAVVMATARFLLQLLKLHWSTLLVLVLMLKQAWDV